MRGWGGESKEIVVCPCFVDKMRILGHIISLVFAKKGVFGIMIDILLHVNTVG